MNFSFTHNTANNSQVVLHRIISFQGNHVTHLYVTGVCWTCWLRMHTTGKSHLNNKKVNNQSLNTERGYSTKIWLGCLTRFLKPSRLVSAQKMPFYLNYLSLNPEIETLIQTKFYSGTSSFCVDIWEGPQMRLMKTHFWRDEYQQG